MPEFSRKRWSTSLPLDTMETDDWAYIHYSHAREGFHASGKTTQYSCHAGLPHITTCMQWIEIRKSSLKSPYNANELLASKNLKWFSWLMALAMPCGDQAWSSSYWKYMFLYVLETYQVWSWEKNTSKHQSKTSVFSKGNYILTMSKANACTMERDKFLI